MSEAYTEQELVEHLVSAITNNDKEFSFDHQQIREALQEYGLSHIRTYAALQRAGMREACAKHVNVAAERWHVTDSALSNHYYDLEEGIRKLPDLAADEALDNFRDAATEAALPLACNAIIESLDGGEFSPVSPLAKVAAAIEKVKAAAQEQWRRLLWLNHARYLPFEHMPYGDDGEMQCCGIDFKRDSAEAIERYLGMRIAALTAAAKESK